MKTPTSPADVLRFEGSYVAIVTPFKDGKVDREGLRGLVEFQIEAGTNGIVPCGTTGESATLSHDEHTEVIAIVVEATGGKIPVLAGTGSNSTREPSIRSTRLIPVMSSSRPPGATDSPSVVSPPPRAVIGTPMLCAARSTSATSAALRASTTPWGIPWTTPPASLT